MRKFELVNEEFRKHEDSKLPLRGTQTSAGYDFYATEDLIIKPQEKVMFWSDVKAQMQEGEVLLGFVRSSMGIKNDLMLSNTVAVIDSDYYNNEETGGNIGISIRNMKPAIGITGKQMLVPSDNIVVSEKGKEVVPMVMPILEDLTEKNTVVIKKGERVAQFIFMSFQESENCNTDVVRTGGIGSTTEEAKQE